jgi:hypothetical protein
VNDDRIQIGAEALDKKHRACPQKVTPPTAPPPIDCSVVVQPTKIATAARLPAEAMPTGLEGTYGSPNRSGQEQTLEGIMPNGAAIRIEAVTGALAGVLVVLLVSGGERSTSSPPGHLAHSQQRLANAADPRVARRIGAQAQLPATALTGLPTINDRDDPNQKAFAHDGKC